MRSVRMLPADSCVICGAAIPPRPSKVYKHKAPRFCSRRCAGFAVAPGGPLPALLQARHPAPVPPEPRRCGVCGRIATGKPRHCSPAHAAEYALALYFTAAWYPDGQPRRLRERSCGYCGRRFTPTTYFTNPGSSCGPDCRKARARRLRRVYESMRRARQRATTVEKVDPIEVFIRDEWVCGLCGWRTDPALRGTTDDLAPELDHIVPLSRGGTHTWDNVQCAHRVCNARKGDLHTPGGASASGGDQETPARCVPRARARVFTPPGGGNPAGTA